MNEATVNAPSPPAAFGAAALAAVTPRQLAWRRFKRHRLALISAWVLGLLYFAALFCEFLAPYSPQDRDVAAINAPPMGVHFISKDGFQLRPFVYGYDMRVNPDTWMREYTANEDERHPLRFFAVGDEYRMWNLFSARRHLFLADGGRVHLFGTDQLGRDVFSRVLHGARVSLSIGIVGVVLTFVLGILFGGVAGYVGGAADRMVQWLVGVLLALPTLPLWMALSAALPVSWSPLAVYFGVTVILSLLGWPYLARQCGGAFWRFAKRIS